MSAQALDNIREIVDRRDELWLKHGVPWDDAVDQAKAEYEQHREGSLA